MNDNNSAGDWSNRGISLANTVQSDVAPCLPLPSLPGYCGAVDPVLRLFDEHQPKRLNQSDAVAQADKIACLLRDTDVSYLNVRSDTIIPVCGTLKSSDLYHELVQWNPDAFECTAGGSSREQFCDTLPTRSPVQKSEPIYEQVSSYRENHNSRPDHAPNQIDMQDMPSSIRPPKLKKKGGRQISSSVVPDSAGHQDTVVRRFCEVLGKFCGTAEVPIEDRDETEWLSLPFSEVHTLLKDILSIRGEKMLCLVPVDMLVRLLQVLDHQVCHAEGLSIDDCPDSDVSSILCALESIHAALAVMVYNDMPKQLYKEEVIERIVEFTRCQLMGVMLASDSAYRALHKPNENGIAEGEDGNDADAGIGSATKRRRISRNTKSRRTIFNRVSSAVSSVLQKLCTILDLVKDLISIERLSDSCILLLLKTSLSTLLIENIQLLQLKSISLISGIFNSYMQHRTHIVEEVVQVLWKLPFSKKVARAYHLPEEEQKQIQMITALLIQLVHHSANLPDTMRQSSSSSTILEAAVDPSFLITGHESATETCVSFWTRVLQRLATVKSQDASELKVIIENMVSDLLTTLNLPEYPASALILEVLSVLLLQNSTPKSKDILIRSMAIDILGAIAGRLKLDAAVYNQEKFWRVRGVDNDMLTNNSLQNGVCSICLDGNTQSFLLSCQGCHRLFHTRCMGVIVDEISSRDWICPLCLSRKQLLVILSYCLLQTKTDARNNLSPVDKSTEAADSIRKMSIFQQILFMYLQDTGSVDDLHLFARWFYLCLWHKDDPHSRWNFSYALARLKSKAIVRDSCAVSSILTRDALKQLALALAQNSTFARGFDTILSMLLARMRENSPIVRAKALRAVSLIVEADPDVLCDKRVQQAVEGRFCDSAILVREAALELVGRHTASYPDVGLKYFDKVAERVKDTGVSVRKRAIKIIRDMCTSNVNFSEFTRACIEIISRVSDEESSIQDLVCKTFYEFWFEESPGGRSHFSGNGSSVPLEVSKKTEQIVDMLRKLPSHQPLVTVFKRNLALDFLPHAVKAAGINTVSLATVRKRCELICKCLLERILQVEETSNEEGQVQTLPYILVLHAFCSVDATLCVPASNPSQFVVTLQPYLKNQVDHRLVAQQLESIIFIIDAVLPLVRKLPQSLVQELEQDLKQMIVRHSFLTVVHACIKCICSTSKIAGKGASVVELLIQAFFKHLNALGVDNKQQVGRSLFCLGLLIRYGYPLVNGSNRSIDIQSSLSLFKQYLCADDFVIKVRALQALGFVLIARPECMLEEDIGRILGQTLSSTCDTRLKLQVLQNMYEYLLDAESHLGTDAARYNVADYAMDDRSRVPVAAGAGDSNICGGIVQLYWDNILERCLDTNEQIRQIALKIVEIVLRQGLVHPITCVPYLIALETDPQETISKLGHHLLMQMNEKYPAFFESRLGDGLQLSFTFMRSLQDSPNSSNTVLRATTVGAVSAINDLSVTNARLGFSRIYKLIRGNRMARNKFMNSVVRKFDSPRWSDTVIPFLMYCTDILALLPFTSPDEPLYLIYTINRVIQVRSGTLEASLKALSFHFSQRDPARNPCENGEVQQKPFFEMNSTDHQEAENRLLPNSMSSYAGVNHVATGSSDIIMGDDLLRVQTDCVAATSIQLLLGLKRHLKIVYSLDDVRCQAFSPTEPPKPGEALSKQIIPLSIGDIHTNLPSTAQELTQRYQVYKNALKEDTVDYSTYSANIKRKRPPSRRGRPVRFSRGHEEDDDEDWTGGVRGLGFGGGQGNSGRVLRQF